MGIISVTQMDQLYWLGRYTERVYTTLRLFSQTYDSMLDKRADDYVQFCHQLEIPDVYGSPEAFLENYPFDEEDPNSIISNLTRAYDNAITLREELGSETISYIQLAIYAIRSAKVSPAPLLRLQEVIDNILAFWGIVDDSIDSEQIRDLIKTGARIERLDLYARVAASPELLEREMTRLLPRLKRSQIPYDEDWLDRTEKLIEYTPIDYRDLIRSVEGIVR